MECDAVIIGGGLSGLSAAEYLISSNPALNIIIIEARNRFGGRTETQSIPSTLGNVDFGAQWIGPSHHEMLSLISVYGFELVEQYYQSKAEENSNYSLTECVGYRNDILQCDHRSEILQYINMIENLSQSICLSSPWSHNDAHDWDNISVKDHIDKSNLLEPSRQELLLFVQSVVALSASKISFLFFLFYVKSSGGILSLGDGDHGAQKWKVKGGTQQISNRLVKSLTEKGVTILSSHLVNSIVQSSVNKIVTVRTTTTISNTTATIKRDLSDSKRNSNETKTVDITCQRVILAISPTLVSKIAFFPPLPMEKKLLCDRMLSGCAIKVIIAYPTAFWLSDDNDPNDKKIDEAVAVGRKTCLVDLGYVHNFFHASLDHSTSCSDLPSATIAAITGGLSSNVTDTKSTPFTPNGVMNDWPALVGLITGDAAVSFGQLDSDEVRQAAVISQIIAMYGHKEIAVAPLYYGEKNWSKEEFSGGCYAANFGPDGSFSKYGSCLRTPIGPLYWAATETAAEFYGYMEGAVRAGKRAAKEILTDMMVTRSDLSTSFS